MGKISRTLGAFAVAAAMSASLSSVAFAAEPLENDANGVTGTTFTSTIQAEKGNTPKTAFTYNITTGGARTVSPDRITTYAGVAGGVTFAGGSSEMTVPFAANDAEEDVALAFDATKFSQPGIYHYYITQSALTDEQKAIGLLADKDAQKSLDVYVAKNADGSMKVTSVVLAQHDETVTIEGANATEATKVSGFTNGFGVEDPDNPSNPDDPDDPYNLQSKTVSLNKTVSGAMGDTTMQFPFDVTISYEEGTDAATTLVGMDVDVIKTAANGEKTTTTMRFGKDALTQGFTLANGESLSFVYPKNADVKVQEKTDAAEGYFITGTLDGVQDATLNGKVNADANGMSKKMGESDVAFAYDNNRETISPTGVVLRFAPYLLIAAAGVIVLLVSRRRKADELD